MSIKFACTCGKAYKVPETFSGKRVKCKQCGEQIRVPSSSQAGVSSSRAAAVSKRSVLESQKLEARSSRREAVQGGKSGRSSRTSASSTRTSARAAATSTRAAATSARSAKASAPGTKTERFTPVDLTEGNALKKYQAKKEEEFRRGEGRLTLFQDGKPVKAYRLTKAEAKIGRGESCGIRLELASVSREHAKIEYKLGTFIISDHQSKNGLVVNGRTVRRSSLRSGDIIQIGEGILRLDC